MLASRIASHALAATSGSGRGWFGAAAQQWRAVSASAGAATDGAQEAAPAAAAAVPTLTAAQRAKLPALLALARRPTATARRLGSLTALSATYRDMSLTLSALAAQQAGLDPLAPADAIDQQWAQQQQQQQQTQAAAQAQASEGSAAATTTASDQGQAGAGSSAAASGSEEVGVLGAHLPLLDVTDSAVSGGDGFAVDGIRPAPQEPLLNPAYMDKVSAWAALAPPHLESSTALQTAVNLWPPSEATYPTYVDFDAALRLLGHHTSRKRLRLGRRLLRKQDRYQLKTWEHHSGEA
ncbi:hypothetical protein CHLRE_07g313050v5 [Chlamydomonas reinhardtii]|uniref:Uncharacterized protein n=1 Tax=Chlamydomonas reinhardtii TaxID=3055 RepID=A0A2K3DIH6_CHLRE|nr:uncharacterized protein CHLRE_07g313050v5 [Chlamydomonas reinhardtii]PNW80330.1 hypothetical protein CHLRE_07g313050v5 [Chlamydomonas reinhardtii]